MFTNRVYGIMFFVSSACFMCLFSILTHILKHIALPETNGFDNLYTHISIKPNVIYNYRQRVKRTNCF
jgi:hypothetical protein